MMSPVMNPAFYDIRARHFLRMSCVTLRNTTLNQEGRFECHYGSLLRHVGAWFDDNNYIFGRRFIGMGASSINGQWLGTMNVPKRIHP